MDRICWCVIFWTLSGPTALQAKTIEVATSAAPQRVEPSVARANVAISADSDRLLRLFRGLHAGMQHGQAAGQIATAIAAELAVSGFEVKRAGHGTLVVALLRNGEGPTVVYRVDAGAGTAAVDAPEVEPARRHTRGRSSAAFRAEHVCGADASLTWMLGMAKALAALRTDWSGTLVLISQPTQRLDAAASLARVQRAVRSLPAPDMLIAFDASSAPLGSLLSVRAQRRPASKLVDFVMSRVGVYEMPRYLDSASRLSDRMIRRYALPDHVPFGYVLVGIADRHLVNEAPDLPGEETFDESEVVPVDVAAIPLGAQLATVAALELLKKRRPSPALVDLTKHRY
jgi:hypothetical protein